MSLAYRIDYAPQASRGRTGRGSILRLQTMTAACFLIFTLLVSWLWPAGTQKLRELLLPGQQGVHAAFQEFSRQLRDGGSVEEALTAFCIQVLEDAHQD